MNIYLLFNDFEKSLFDQLKSDEGRRLFSQEFFKRNFSSLVYLLGYRDLGICHKDKLNEISEQIDYGVPRRKLWLWARGHFKSSLITEAHTIYLLINNPDLRILIVSNTLEVAKSFLKNIKDHFIKNEDFRYFFREFCPIPNKDGKIEFGTTENFTLPNRKKVLKESSVMCAGIGTNLTGFHFDLMKIDDLVTKDSVTNDTQILASKEYYSSLRQLFDKPTCPQEDVIGTTYHFNDLYQEIIKNKDFKKSFMPIMGTMELKDDRVVYNDGPINFPERFNSEGIESLKNDPNISPYSWLSQYCLNPIDPTKAKFKEEWIKYYDTPTDRCSQYICVDPASTQKKKSDYTVLQRWGVDYEGKHYLLEGIRDKLTAFQRIDKLFQLVRNSGKDLKWVKYEVLGGRHGDLEVIKERQISERLFFLIKETKSTTASKSDRIEQRLAGPYNSGCIHFPKSLIFKSEFDGKTYDFVQLFKLELLQFPFTEHDDMLDCQSQMFEEETIKGQKPVVNVEKKITAQDWEDFYDNIEREHRKNPFADKDMIYKKMFGRKVRGLLTRV